MVRLVVLSLALGLAAGASAAQPVDWSRAGGGLFVGQTASAANLAPIDDDLADTVQMTLSQQPHGEAIASAAAKHGLDPKLLHALVAVESAYRADAVSTAGAAGLTQLMPATATEVGVADRFDVASNTEGGALYLAAQLRRFGDVRLALAAYNSGPERVARLGRAPRIAETQDYVVKVVDCYLALTAGRAIRSARDCRPAGAAP